MTGALDNQALTTFTIKKIPLPAPQVLETGLVSWENKKKVALPRKMSENDPKIISEIW